MKQRVVLLAKKFFHLFFLFFFLPQPVPINRTSGYVHMVRIVDRLKICAFRYSVVFRLHVSTSTLRDEKTGNKKRATCLATLLQNKLNSDVARFITHIKSVLQQIRLLTGLNMGCKPASSLFNSFCSNVAKQVARFLLPVFPYFNKSNGANCNSCYVGEMRRHFHTPAFLASDKPSHVFKH